MTTITVLPGGVVADAPPGQSILQALHQQGHAYRTGCRRGGCGICKVDLRSGSVHYSHPVADTVLTAEERSSGTCLSCRAVPDGDVTIELRDEQLRTNPLLELVRQHTPVHTTR